MNEALKIEAALSRNVRAFQQRPSVAKDTTSCRTTLRDGFFCTTREGDHIIETDMPEIMGGAGNGPTPGVLGRACLASCIAMGIKIAATQNKISINTIQVDLEMDWDNRGMLGIDGISAGPSNIKIRLAIDSSANTKLLHEVVDQGLNSDPWLIALTKVHTVDTEIDRI
ncbi:MAG: putative OsmC-like protein [Gammaproteobacteria bacterium]|jgi:uncharacterized OsmC-like protein